MHESVASIVIYVSGVMQMHIVSFQPFMVAFQ